MPQAVLVKKFRKGFQKKPLFIIAGTSVSKKATDRNRIRRRIRVIMTPIMKEQRNDYAIIVKRGALALSYKNLKEEILKFIHHDRTV
ncbi:MAG: ribonuclease P protein component [Candidatus Jorgensenbacteria bacterium]|nr:ribonuclease P protein component [Candidatus Jorgensenbacteria bacterium]